jgi:hypothetical protein
VGTLNWAGGNVWFDTEQYRNNYAPTNAPNAGFAWAANYGDTANQLEVNISGLAYSQGANIATHIAVLVRANGGSISLTSDHIVTLINIASIPTSYIVPYPLNACKTYTIGIAACALTKDGYSFNPTVRQYSLSGNTDMVIQATSALWISAGVSDQVNITSESKFWDDITLVSGKKVDGRDISVDGSALDSHTGASSSVHGISGSVVGTSDAQTLTNKYFNGNTVGKGVRGRHFESAPTWSNEVPGIFSSNISGVRRIGWYDGANNFTIVLPDLNAI